MTLVNYMNIIREKEWVKYLVRKTETIKILPLPPKTFSSNKNRSSDNIKHQNDDQYKNIQINLITKIL